MLLTIDGAGVADVFISDKKHYNKAVGVTFKPGFVVRLGFLFISSRRTIIKKRFLCFLRNYMISLKIIV